MQPSIPNFDASFCGRLPLHQVNLIQPHGVLLLVDKASGTVIQTSENVSALLGLPAAAIVRQSLHSFLSAESYKALTGKREKIRGGRLPLTLAFLREGKEAEVLVLVQEKEEYYILEAELDSFIPRKTQSFVSVFVELKEMIASIEAAQTLEEVCTVAAREIRALSGFDKVMIYHFDEDWNGTVLAESMEEGMDRYLGLKFPASDVPKPARDLYLKNPYRIIPNRDYTPVKLYPVLNPLTNALSDLSVTNLRSVATVHLEYLKNMGVVASMSTRIVHNNGLWGLVSCHHRTAKYLSYEECSVFELLSNVLSARISALINQEVFQAREDLNRQFNQMVERVYRRDEFLPAVLGNRDQLLLLLKADGVAISWNGYIETMGTTPSPADVESICYWLQGKPGTGVLHLPTLSDDFEEGVSFAETGSGMLALPIQPEKGNFILAFRPEAVRTVPWGGNPHEALQFEPDQKAYHPRDSFRIWQETVRNSSVPWTEEEIAAADNFRNFVVEYTLNKLSH